MFLSSISMKLKIFNNIWIEFLLIIDRQRFGKKMIYFTLENVLNINKKLFDNKNQEKKRIYCLKAYFYIVTSKIYDLLKDTLYFQVEK